MAERARRWSRLLSPALLCLALLALGAAPAQGCQANSQGTFGVSPGCADVRISAARTPGNAAPDFFQAGGHPYEMTTAIRLNALSTGSPEREPFTPPEPLRDVDFSLPAGFAADLRGVPTCSVVELIGTGEFPTCAPDSQVGTVSLRTYVLGPVTLGFSLFRLKATDDAPVRLGFNGLGPVNILDATVSAEGRLSFGLTNINETPPPNGVTVSLWGVPADPAHTPQRGCPGSASPLDIVNPGGPSCPASLPPRAMLRLPTRCSAPGTVSYGVASWTHPGEFQGGSFALHRSPGLIGDPTGTPYPAKYPGLDAALWGPPQGFMDCGLTPFDPSMTTRLSTQSADSPTGLDVEIAMPQQGLEDPTAIAESDLESGTVTLPPQLSLNPAIGNGLATCSAAQVDLDSNAEARCPDASKLGTVELATPLLPAPLTGAIYVAEPDRGHADGADLSTYIVASGAGTTFKIPSRLEVDPGDGQITANFDALPQIPIGSLKLHFFGGDRAPFVTPPLCGSYAVDGRFAPWSGAGAVEVGDTLAITSAAGGGPCPDSIRGLPFEPTFRAGLSNPMAGAASSLALELAREDGEQELSSLELSLPAGMSADLSDVPTCSDADLALTDGRAAAAELETSSCPAGSRIGSVSAALGAGKEPVVVQGGKAYLAGPYEGAPFSFALVLPAQAGPLDLETLVVRLPLKPDPTDGRLALNTQLPSLEGGIRLRLRGLTIKVDRPSFLTNPTSCRPGSASGQIGGNAGAIADVSAPLRVTGCELLGFRPRLRMKVIGGPAATKRGGHPGLRTVLRTRRGDANLKRTAITLAASEQLDPTRLRSICTRRQFAADACPRDSVYGSVRAITPLADAPLKGPVYLRQSSNKLPDLVASLGGDVDLDLTGRLGYTDGRMRIVLGPLPDFPVSKLTLTMLGGRRGLFVNNRHLCDARVFSAMKAVAQNGKVAKRRPALGVPCGVPASNVTGSDKDGR